MARSSAGYAKGDGLQAVFKRDRLFRPCSRDAPAAASGLRNVLIYEAHS